MARQYDRITYRPPSGTAAQYAEKALNILQELQQVSPATLPIFMAANSVLTLSGVRAYDAYHEFYDFIAESDIRAAEEALGRHGVRIMRSDGVFRNDETDVDIFELINDGSLAKLWQTYQVPGYEELAAAVRPDMPYDGLHFVAWSFMVERDLAETMRNDTLPKAWLDDWWAPHNIRFGMLLGYPAKAIESYLWDEPDHHDIADYDSGQDLLDAEIDYYDSYYAAWPVYSYAPTLRTDPQILAHQRLWSDILRLVYTSDWHKRLETDTIFQEAYHNIKDREESSDEI